jgi:hypothetical protein
VRPRLSLPAAVIAAWRTRNQANHSQEETPMDSHEAASRWAATWTAAWRTHDLEPVVALYAADCVHRSTPFRPPHRGRQGMRDYVIQAFADERGVEDVWFGAPVVERDRACVE